MGLEVGSTLQFVTNSADSTHLGKSTVGFCAASAKSPAQGKTSQSRRGADSAGRRLAIGEAHSRDRSLKDSTLQLIPAERMPPRRRDDDKIVSAYAERHRPRNDP